MDDQFLKVLENDELIDLLLTLEELDGELEEKEKDSDNNE